VSDLNLGIIGNCGIAALIDRRASLVWCCLPRFDKDPVFHSLLGSPKDAPGEGVFSVEMDDLVSSEQSYVSNTALLKTILHGRSGSVQIVDFIPRFYWRDRAFRPQMIIRRIIPAGGSPRIRIRVKPRFEYGNIAPNMTFGSNHIRYAGPKFAIRLTTDAPADYILAETSFNLAEPLNLILGPDETLTKGAGNDEGITPPLRTQNVVEHEIRGRFAQDGVTLKLPLVSKWLGAACGGLKSSSLRTKRRSILRLGRDIRHLANRDEHGRSARGGV